VDACFDADQLRQSTTDTLGERVLAPFKVMETTRSLSCSSSIEFNWFSAAMSSLVLGVLAEE